MKLKLFILPPRVLQTKKKQTISTIPLRQSEVRITMMVNSTKKINRICSNIYFTSF